MFDALGSFFDSSTLAPHGICLLWRPELIWAHVISDALTGAAYFSIPVALAAFVVKRKDVAFSWVFWCFALFIVACGTTHFFSIWTLWRPDYGAEAVVKAATAAVSVVTAAALWPLLPRALALPSPGQLAAANAALEARIRERDAAILALETALAERDRAEAELRQAQKMDALGRLTGGVAHDFNNLLMVISANLELLGKRLPAADEKARRLVENAAKGAERGAALTRRMLAFARKEELDPRPIEAARLVAGLEDLLRRSLGPQVRLVVDAPDDLPPLEADANQLELALVNLVINARDAMPSGGTVTISAALEDVAEGAVAGLPSGRYVRIDVADDGVGMDARTLERAVEPFFTTKGVGQGTGLGLSMAHGFARQSGGALAVRSAPGVGTVVTLRLPLARGAAPETPGAQAPGASAPAARLRVLAVDDDALVLAGVVAVLEDLGHVAIAAESGERALALVRAGAAVDLVLTDHAMPGMTGARLAREIAAIRPGLPVVVATGYAEAEPALEGLARIGKPFRRDDLAAALAAAVAAAGPRAELA